MTLLSMLKWSFVGLYVSVSLALAIYGLNCLYLLCIYLRNVKSKRATQREIITRFLADEPRSDWPGVTTQIPIYNEAPVAERVIRAAAAMHYPKPLHDIQILDDSTDETRDIVDQVVAELQSKGTRIEVIRRSDRVGYKAGALEVGMQQTQSELIALFDADFVPPTDFLERAVALIMEDESIACLQGRWEHINRNESWLTRAIAIGMDGHFAVEQGSRGWHGFLMNFNGTAGIWRRQAIIASGGWQHDTVTEDLDLSYRAQMAGYRIDYCQDLPCPAEIPSDMHAFKAQQTRWATGTAQTARKLMGRLWTSPKTLGQKIQGTFHLGGYFISLLMLMQVLMALPLLQILKLQRGSFWLSASWTIILTSAAAPLVLYGSSILILGRPRRTFLALPSLIVLGLGVCLNNALAVLKGLKGHSDLPFIRTPKQGSGNHSKGVRRYAAPRSPLWFWELMFASYALLAFSQYLMQDVVLAGVFMILYALGFSLTALHSLPRQGLAVPEATLPVTSAEETVVNTTEDLEVAERV